LKLITNLAQYNNSEAVRVLLEAGAEWKGVRSDDCSCILFASLCYYHPKVLFFLTFPPYSEKRKYFTHATQTDLPCSKLVFDVLVRHGVTFQSEITRLLYEEQIEQAQAKAQTAEDLNYVLLYGCIKGCMELVRWAWRQRRERFGPDVGRKGDVLGTLIGARYADVLYYVEPFSCIIRTGVEYWTW
jgi:hypothetical protein